LSEKSRTLLPRADAEDPALRFGYYTDGVKISIDKIYDVFGELSKFVEAASEAPGEWDETTRTAMIDLTSTLSQLGAPLEQARSIVSNIDLRDWTKTENQEFAINTLREFKDIVSQIYNEGKKSIDYISTLDPNSEVGKYLHNLGESMKPLFNTLYMSTNGLIKNYNALLKQWS
jgi:hypothetical protein